MALRGVAVNKAVAAGAVRLHCTDRRLIPIFSSRVARAIKSIFTANRRRPWLNSKGRLGTVSIEELSVAPFNRTEEAVSGEEDDELLVDVRVKGWT